MDILCGKENNLKRSKIIIKKNQPNKKPRKILGEISNRSIDDVHLEDVKSNVNSDNIYEPRPDIVNNNIDHDILLFNEQYPYEIRLYVNDIYNSYKLNEEQFILKESYIEKQNHINIKMRTILIDWLVDVHNKFKLQSETLFLSICYLDRYLSLNIIDKNIFQLIGVTCMFIASKYEELYFPEIKEFIKFTDDSYNVIDVKRMEGKILNSLKFKLTQPTINTFLERLLKCDNNNVLNNVSYYFAERTLQEYKLIFYLPSIIAASSVYLARKYLGYQELWTELHEKISGYKESEIFELTNTIDKIVRESQPNHIAVWRKYTRSVRNRASYIVHDKIGNTGSYVYATEMKDKGFTNK